VPFGAIRDLRKTPDGKIAIFIFPYLTKRGFYRHTSAALLLKILDDTLLIVFANPLT
jgi:hypothetical protein